MKTVLILVATLIAAFGQVHAGIGDEALRRKIGNLRNDRKEGNCGDAQDLLVKNVENPRVQAALLNELYSTKDLQSKESCLVLLCRAKSFQPDEKFIRTLLARIRVWGSPYDPPCCEPAGDVGAIFLVGHAAKYGDLIAAEIREGFSPKDNSLWYQYIIIRTLAKAGIIAQHANRFTPGYLHALAKNLQNDDVLQNAKVATAAFLLLGKIGLPVLQEVPRASDLQGRELASAIVAYLSGTGPLSKLAQNEETDEISGRLGASQLADFDPNSPADVWHLVTGPIPLKVQNPEESSERRDRPLR